VVDRVQQPDRSLLDEVVDRQAVVAVTRGYGPDEWEVALDEAGSRTGISAPRRT
jgi:hypothetical protein